MDDDLWPARNVAEHAYCPRLFYFMQVEGVFLPSAFQSADTSAHSNKAGQFIPELADELVKEEDGERVATKTAAAPGRIVLEDGL